VRPLHASLEIGTKPAGQGIPGFRPVGLGLVIGIIARQLTAYFVEKLQKQMVFGKLGNLGSIKTKGWQRTWQQIWSKLRKIRVFQQNRPKADIS